MVYFLWSGLCLWYCLVYCALFICSDHFSWFSSVCFTLFSVSYRFLNSVGLSLHYVTLIFLATDASSLLFPSVLNSSFISCHKSVLRFLIWLKTCLLTEVTRACSRRKEGTFLSDLSLEDFHFKASVERSWLQPSLSRQLVPLSFVNWPWISDNVKTIMCSVA